MARQLFGTDGIRGVAGEYPLDDRTVHAFGLALGHWASRRASAPQILIGMDTRESGPRLAAIAGGGLMEAGARPQMAGLITTPGVAYLTRTRDFIAGVMISASHNPYQDNGLKVFDHSGFKLPDDVELALEKEIFAIRESDPAPAGAALPVDERLDAGYVDYLVSTMTVRLDGLRIVIDCANGAASHLAVEMFQRLGANIVSIACEPNGRNINLDCGALHLDGLVRAVLAHKADCGVAFDGDADRCMLVSGTGRVIDGDAVLLIVSQALAAAGELAQNLVVATVMSNLGLERALQSRGIAMLRTPVGDKYVLEEMERRGAALGGEQSGHVIFRRYATTGDGMLTALRVIEIAKRSGKSLDELAAMDVYPQRLVNVRVKTRRPLEQLPAVQAEIRDCEQAFGDAGRVLVRFSGTEPLARVMVEGPDASQVGMYADRIAGAIRAALGA